MLCHFAYEFVDKRRQTRKLGSYCCVAYILYLCAEAVDCFKHGCALAVCGVDLYKQELRGYKARFIELYHLYYVLKL